MATTMGHNTSFNTTNVTVSPWHDDLVSFVGTLRHIYAISLFVLSPVIVVANLILISSILTNARLRNELRYGVMVSIAVADFLIGLLSCPIRGEIMLANSSNFHHSCLALLIVSLIEEYAQITVATWGIVTINVDYLFTLFQVKRPELSSSKHKLVVSSILLLPWFTILFIILPAVSSHFKELYERYQICYLFTQTATAHIVVPLTFIIPSFIIICQNAIMVGVNRLQKQKKHHGMQLLMTSPWVFVVAGFVTVGLVGIEQCGQMAQKHIRKAFGKVIFTLYYSGIFLSDSKSAVTPLLWFALPELRAAFMELFSRLPWRRVSDRRENGVETSVVELFVETNV